MADRIVSTIKGEAATQAEVEAAMAEDTAEPVATATDEAETPDEGLIGGFIPGVSADGDGKPQHGAVHPDLNAQAPTAPVESAPLFTGLTKTLKTPAELAAYAAELEKKTIEYEAKLSVYDKAAPAAAAPSEGAKKKNYAERLFTDPDAVINELRADITNEIENKTSARETDKAFWTQFYAENTDLRGAEEIVDLKLSQKRSEWEKAKVTTTQARALLADEARKYVNELVNRRKPTETLPSGKTHVLAASGNTAPRVNVPDTPKSFSDQVRALRKGKKAVS